MAHFLQAIAWVGLRDYEKADQSLRTALAESAFSASAFVARAIAEIQDEGCGGGGGTLQVVSRDAAQRAGGGRGPEERRLPIGAQDAILPHNEASSCPHSRHEVFIVSGLPRSGTSDVDADARRRRMPILHPPRAPPMKTIRGAISEHEAVKSLFRERGWLSEGAAKR